MLYRSEEKLKLSAALLLTGILFIACSLSSCASASGLAGSTFSSERLSPLEIIPGDFSLYIQAESSFTNISVLKTESEKKIQELGVPEYFVDKTDRLTAVLLQDGWAYFTAGGRYPDLLIKNYLGDSPDWKGKTYKRIKYYFGSEKQIALIPLGSNYIIAFQADHDNYSDRAEKIIEILRSGQLTAAAPKADNSVFHITSKKTGSGFSRILPSGFNPESISEINADLIISPDAAGKAGLRASFTTPDEKTAALFTSFLRLFLVDYLRNEGIMDLRKIREMSSVSADGCLVYVSIDGIPFEKMDKLTGFFINK